MAYVGKTYKHERDENFEAFVDSLGLTAEHAAGFKSFKPTQRLEKNGNTFTLVTMTPSGEKKVDFQDGATVDEPVTAEVVAKTTFTVNGNTVTQVQKFNDGRTLTLKREYSPDKLVITLTNNSWDGTAYRYYTAA